MDASSTRLRMRRVRVSIVAVALFGVCVVSVLTAGVASSAGAASTATVLMGFPPDTLDPQATIGTLTQEETDANVYLNLVQFKQANGTASNDLVPAAATSLPTISNHGKTYTFFLRKQIRFSNGQLMKPSDFAYSVERALKLHWGLGSALIKYIRGAAEYAAGKAPSISGVTTDDASGRITIQLVAPYGPLLDDLALAGGASIVPSGTPMRAMPNNPPLGAGPYKFASVKPNSGFTLVKNPYFVSAHIPGLLPGYIDTINVQFVSNSSSEAEEVLSNKADNFDSSDTIPPTLLPQIKAQASDRFRAEPTLSTNYFFLNVSVPPFDNILARQAVNYAIDRRAMVRLASGFLRPSCTFLPQALAGSLHGRCQYETAAGGPKLAVARQLLKRAKLVGYPVTVWGYYAAPFKQWTDYYTSVLNSIGFKAQEKLVATSAYYSTIGTVKNHAQTGFNNFFLPPNPAFFYSIALGSASISSTNNNNVSMVRDAHIDSTVAKLSELPASRLAQAASQWQALDRYESKESYVIPFGAFLQPVFFSDRIDAKSAIFSLNVFNVWSSWKLK